MRPLLILVLLAVLAYAGLTAYAGFRVARVGVRLMGRDAVERLAIRKGNVPRWIAESPAFWMALRANE